ncbi:MAG: D-alanine--D-alanine ligase family protein [Rothia sp. (in: high G+C Gram-positive bacteria)]|uniref:D-alanine--D-alanine ligase family protein n=1 Tax=Rothia sp. (in: high G+C Gram-positive bacteria) TaxID=1885016 RepID=UPI0026E0E3EF|nr:D-alanine--D-alanine ligase family protein [Rothia sp. (in: high G+C Gram-positive bacteria)]MDO5750960.1 D-alanine--D-alanine ligase family protein [Rothia sp. (in: high G+C Gram-positive bacteria)]
MTDKLTIALLTGGRSSEHSISLITAVGVLGALDRSKYDVVIIGITRDGRWYLASEEQLRELVDADQAYATFEGGGQQVFLPLGAQDSRLRLVDENQQLSLGSAIDVVFPLLHGPFGEDGTLQGLLEMADLKYVGCGVTASAIGMDKHFMKLAFEAAGLEVGPYEVVTDRQWRHNREEALERVNRLQYPVFVKPTRAGSSFGITKVDEPSQLQAAIEEARTFDPKVIIEQGIDGREIELSVLDGHHGQMPRVSYPGEIEVVQQSEQAFYDFEAKYVSKTDAVTRCPADLPQQVQDELREQAVRAFLALDGEGLSRADFFYTSDGRVLINEVNTMPGFTPISMYKTLWEYGGLSYSELIDELISLAVERPLGLR